MRRFLARTTRVLLLLGLTLTLSPLVLPSAAQEAGIEKIAFVSADQATDTMTLMIANPDGSNLQSFLINSAIYHPVWSPDGRHLAFSASLPNYSRTDVYVIDSDGSNLRKVSDRPSQYPGVPAWSSDSTQVFYTLPGGSGLRDKVNLVNIDNPADGTLTLPIDFTATILYEMWVASSPDGAQIAFVAYNDALFGSKPGVFVANADGSDVQPFPAAAPDGTPFQHLNWSPDGQHVLLTFINGAAYGHDILGVADANGANLHEIQGAARNIWGGAWSPDGSQILFAANEAGADVMPDLDLWVVNADGSNLHTLNVEPYVTYQMLTWGLIPADVVLPSTPIVLSDALE